MIILVELSYSCIILRNNIWCHYNIHLIRRNENETVLWLYRLSQGHRYNTCHTRTRNVPLSFRNRHFPHATVFCACGSNIYPPLLINIKQFVIKKINRIFIPFVFFTLLSFILELCIGKINADLPFNGPLWFFKTIFSAVIIYLIMHLLIPSKVYMGILSFTLFIGTILMARHFTWVSQIPFDLERAFTAVIFIHIGYILKEILPKVTFKKGIFPIALFLVVYALGVYFSLHVYSISKAHFLDLKIFTYNIPISLITSISGLMACLLVCTLIKRIKFVNWLGQNSMIVMSIHFPLIERLNVLCAGSALYDSVSTRLAIALLSYLATLVFCSVMIQLCNRYIPKLTGYSNLI